MCTRENCETPTAAPIAEVPAIRWAVGPWSQCSAACGRGTQKRLVICRDHVRDLPDRFCEHLEKMEDVQQCELKPCTYWRTGPWMPVSYSCFNVSRKFSVLSPVVYMLNRTEWLLACLVMLPTMSPNPIVIPLNVRPW